MLSLSTQSSLVEAIVYSYFSSLLSFMNLTFNVVAVVISTLHKRPGIMKAIRRQQSNKQNIMNTGDVTRSRTQSCGSRSPNPVDQESRCAALDTGSKFSERSTNLNTAYQSRRIQWSGGLISFIISGLIVSSVSSVFWYLL